MPDTPTDLELTKLCAEAMGWKHLGAVGVKLSPDELKEGPSAIDRKYPGELWCLSGHNDWWLNPSGGHVCQPCYGSVPAPLHDDAQAMALVVKMRLRLEPNEFGGWSVAHLAGTWIWTWNADERPNRAIVECVAKTQRATDQDTR